MRVFLTEFALLCRVHLSAFPNKTSQSVGFLLFFALSECQKGPVPHTGCFGHVFAVKVAHVSLGCSWVRARRSRRVEQVGGFGKAGAEWQPFCGKAARSWAIMMNLAISIHPLSIDAGS